MQLLTTWRELGNVTTFHQFWSNFIACHCDTKSSTSWRCRYSSHRRAPYLAQEWQLIVHDAVHCHLCYVYVSVCVMPRTGTRLRDRSFSVDVQRIWNNPPSILWQPDMDFFQFKWPIKTFFFVLDHSTLITFCFWCAVYKFIYLLTYRWSCCGLWWPTTDCPVAVKHWIWWICILTCCSSACTALPQDIDAVLVSVNLRGLIKIIFNIALDVFWLVECSSNRHTTDVWWWQSICWL